jgi:hypothetical protein
LQDSEFTFREGMSQSTCFHSFGFRALFGQFATVSREIARRALTKRLVRSFLHSITWLPMHFQMHEETIRYFTLNFHDVNLISNSSILRIIYAAEKKRKNMNGLFSDRNSIILHCSISIMHRIRDSPNIHDFEHPCLLIDYLAGRHYFLSCNSFPLTRKI